MSGSPAPPRPGVPGRARSRTATSGRPSRCGVASPSRSGPRLRTKCEARSPSVTRVEDQAEADFEQLIGGAVLENHFVVRVQVEAEALDEEAFEAGADRDEHAVAHVVASELEFAIVQLLAHLREAETAADAARGLPVGSEQLVELDARVQQRDRFVGEGR